jgi:hypothetical protein
MSRRECCVTEDNETMCGRPATCTCEIGGDKVWVCADHYDEWVEWLKNEDPDKPPFSFIIPFDPDEIHG